jgi:hypothetical protein
MLQEEQCLCDCHSWNVREKPTGHKLVESTFFQCHLSMYCDVESVWEIGDLRVTLKLPYGLGRGEGREPRAPQNTTQPCRTASWHNAHLTQKPAAPMCRRKHRTPGDRISMHCARPNTGVASVRWDKDIPALTRTILGQLCAAPWVSRSRTAATEPGLTPRISSGAAMQCFRPLRQSGGTFENTSYLQRYIHYKTKTSYWRVNLSTAIHLVSHPLLRDLLITK